MMWSEPTTKIVRTACDAVEHVDKASESSTSVIFSHALDDDT